MLETAGLDSAVLDAGIAAQQLQLVNAIVDEDRQYATRLTITRTDNENASESVISTVISWLMKKKVLSKEHCDSFRDGAYSTPDGWNGTTELEQGKTALASKRNSGVPGCVVWAMELDEQDHRLIYGRSGRVNTMDSKRTMMRPQSSFCFASTSLTRGFTSRAWMPSLWYGVPRRRRFSISSLGVH